MCKWDCIGEWDYTFILQGGVVIVLIRFVFSNLDRCEVLMRTLVEYFWRVLCDTFLGRLVLFDR
jgi:hypothetical protein